MCYIAEVCEVWDSLNKATAKYTECQIIESIYALNLCQLTIMGILGLLVIFNIANIFLLV